MRKRILPVIGLLLALCIALSGCSSKSFQISDLEAPDLPETGVMEGAREAVISLLHYSVNESGMLYLRNQLMRYYDFGTNQAYVLCDRANCRHINEKCPAYYAPESVTGLAMFGGSVYVIRRNEEKNTFDLLQTDIKSEQQRVIYSIPIGTREPDSWHVEEIPSVLNTKDTAWITLGYGYVSADGSGSYATGTGTEILKVRLSDGTAVKLRERPEDTNVSYSIAGLSGQYAIVKKSWYSPAYPPDTAAFYAAMKEGAYSEFAASSDPYNDYFDWCMN